MNSLTAYHAKIFGVGAAFGGLIEVVLIKGNYYQMLAASEAKQRLKDLKQEQEDAERFARLKNKTTTESN